MMKKTAMLLTFSWILWTLAGCAMPARSPSGRSDHLQAAAVADDTGKDTHSAVEAAQEWSRKYALLADKCMKLQQETSTLGDQNRELTSQLEQKARDLVHTQQELADANSVLAELSEELGQWKKDVLGFREEIRNAQQAQIDMMSRMIVLLGGEVPQLTPSGQEPLASRTQE
jgi:chromosome segregation ATPase